MKVSLQSFRQSVKIYALERCVDKSELIYCVLQQAGNNYYVN